MGSELKRVPLDFDWALKEVWQGYLMPEHLQEERCLDCGGSGYSALARRLHNLWWGYDRFDPATSGRIPLSSETPEVRAFAQRNLDSAPDFYGSGGGALDREGRRLASLWNGMWQHHLTQEEVDILVADECLHDFTHTFVRGEGWVAIEPTPTVAAEEVNLWSLTAMQTPGEYTLIKAKCAAAGLSDTCAICDGHGNLEKYGGQRAESAAWRHTEPPEGDGYQLWETTSEGSPTSPVFETIEELCEYAAENCSVFAHDMVSAERWREMLDEDFVRSEYEAEDGTKVIFI